MWLLRKEKKNPAESQNSSFCTTSDEHGVGSTTGASVTLLGLAQDGGVPQAGCSCERCLAVLDGRLPELYPVALGISDEEGNCHLVEASRTLAKQLYVWSECTAPLSRTIDSVNLTHLHLGHVDGMGQFGKEVMDRTNVRLITSQPNLHQLEHRGRYLLAPFSPEPFDRDNNEGDVIHKVVLGRGVSLEFHRVPHRDDEGIGDTHAIVVRGARKSILFLPDHDKWSSTLELHGADSIRNWLREKLHVNVALLDGTFWSLDEIKPRRDFEAIPHPPISETIRMLGPRQNSDPEVWFIHLNHTNPAVDKDEIQQRITDSGWGVGRQGQRWQIG